VRQALPREVYDGDLQPEEREGSALEFIGRRLAELGARYEQRKILPSS
jgi:hypothetical protein